MFFFLVQRHYLEFQEKAKAGFHMLAIDLQSLPSSLWSLGKSYGTVEIELISILAITITSVCDCLGSDHIKTSLYQPIFYPPIDGPVKREVRKLWVKRSKKKICELAVETEKMKQVRYLLYLKMIDMREKNRRSQYKSYYGLIHDVEI